MRYNKIKMQLYIYTRKISKFNREMKGEYTNYLICSM